MLQYKTTGNNRDARCCYEVGTKGSAAAASLATGLLAGHPGVAEDQLPLQLHLAGWEQVTAFSQQQGEEGSLGWQVGLGRTWPAGMDRTDNKIKGLCSSNNQPS